MKGPRQSQTLHQQVTTAREYLVRVGHVEPVVAATTPTHRCAAGSIDERFEIGSVTKLFTCLLLAQLAREGVVRLDDRVADIVPARTPLAPRVGDITLEHLACHRSGLPRLPVGLARRGLSRKAMTDPYADIDDAALFAGLARTRLRGTPGTAPPRYSNLGVGLLGNLLGRVTGCSLGESLEVTVLAPLNLVRTSFEDDPLHVGRYRRRPVPPWHLAALAGAGGLRSSAANLLTLLEAVRDGGTPLDAAIAETLRPRFETSRLGVGLGWFLDGDVLFHNGGTLGARSEIRLDRRTGTGAVVLGDGRRGTARAATMAISARGAAADTNEALRRRG